MNTDKMLDKIANAESVPDVVAILSVVLTLKTDRDELVVACRDRCLALYSINAQSRTKEIEEMYFLGEIDDLDTKATIDYLHEKNKFKLELMKSYVPLI
jgi:hypothetical protein